MPKWLEKQDSKKLIISLFCVVMSLVIYIYQSDQTVIKGMAADIKEIKEVLGIQTSHELVNRTKIENLEREMAYVKKALNSRGTVGTP